MKRTLAAAAILVAATIANAAIAQKSGAKPGGTIYFACGGHYNTMAPDGSAKTSLPAGVTGVPSRILHGGQRWFLTTGFVSGMYPDGRQRREVFAVPEDGSPAVQLTDDPSLQPLHYGYKWAPGEETDQSATIAGFARRWDSTGAIDTASVGLYEATVSFDQAGAPTSRLSTQSFVASAGIHYDSGSTIPWPDVQGWDFSPDASKIVADHSDYVDMRVITLSTGNWQTVYRGNVSDPSWSPDGGRISFHIYSSAVPYGAIAAIAPDGSAYKVVVKARAGFGVFGASWSPDSAYLLFTQSTDSGTATYDVCRVSATGGSQVNLTTDLAGFADSVAWR